MEIPEKTRKVMGTHERPLHNSDDDEWEGPEEPSISHHDAAISFIKACGLNPTPDAAEQLVKVFLPCLKIMCERGYSPDGNTWQIEGWRGMLWKIRDKSDRLWFHGWRQGRFNPDHGLDMINYLGFYHRLAHNGPPWGVRGEPGTTDKKSEILEGIKDGMTKLREEFPEKYDRNYGEKKLPQAAQLAMASHPT